MSDKNHRPCYIADPWQAIKKHTSARVGIGRAGHSLPTHEWLRFQMDHANARDAVHIPLDLEKLIDDLPVENYVLRLSSQAATRDMYLQRPDLGRRLGEVSHQRLTEFSKGQPFPARAAIVIADGLSSTAVQQHAPAMVEQIMEALAEHKFTLAPLCVVSQGRVAIGDEIGQLLDVELLILLVGERPGLSSPDSLGIYYTFKPKRGRQDAERNCISNIRPGGLTYEEATDKLMWLILRSIQMQVSGIQLKDQSEALVSPDDSRHSEPVFLLAPENTSRE